MKKNKFSYMLVLTTALLLTACGGSKKSQTSLPSSKSESSINGSSQVSQTSNNSTSNSSVNSVTSNTPSSGQQSSSTSKGSSSTISSSSSTSSINSSSNPVIEVTAKANEMTIERTKEYIDVNELFNIQSGIEYTLNTANDKIVKLSATGKRFAIVRGGDVKLGIRTTSGVTASIDVTVVDTESSLVNISSKLATIKNGYNITGYSFEGATVKQIYDTVTPNYSYSNYKEEGVGVFKDGNVYKFKATTTGGFTGVGSSLGAASIWRKNLFNNFTVTNKYITKQGNDFIIPYVEIGSENNNPLATSFAKQFGLSSNLEFMYIKLTVGELNELQLSIITHVNGNEEVAIAEYIMSDFGTAGVPDVEAWLETADIPVVTDTSVDSLKAVFNKYIHSTSYRMFGADILDSDREIFYNYYSPTQFYEYFMDEGSGLINLDNKVYTYTADANNHVVLGNVVEGITDYKQKVETAYDLTTDIFDGVIYNSTQECFIYVPTATNNALAKYLLHTLGYDSNGKDNCLNAVKEIAFLVEGDIIYVDINFTAAMGYGQVKFQFDSLNTASMPEYIKPTNPDGVGSQYAGYYVGKGTINTAMGKYTDVESTLRLNADLTGLFTFNETQYTITWTAEDDPTNQNKVNFNFTITSDTPKGESFVTVYKYKSNPDVLNITFNYDSSVVHNSGNAYRIQK